MAKAHGNEQLNKKVMDFVHNYVRDNNKENTDAVKDALEQLKDPNSEFSKEFATECLDILGFAKLIRNGCSLNILVKKEDSKASTEYVTMIDKIYEETAKYSLKWEKEIDAIWKALLDRSDFQEIFAKDEARLQELLKTLDEKRDIMVHTLGVRINIDKATDILSTKKEQVVEEFVFDDENPDIKAAIERYKTLLQEIFEKLKDPKYAAEFSAKFTENMSSADKEQQIMLRAVQSTFESGKVAELSDDDIHELAKSILIEQVNENIKMEKLSKQATDFIYGYILNNSLSDDNPKVKYALEQLKDPNSEFSLRLSLMLKLTIDSAAFSGIDFSKDGALGVLKLIRSGCSLELKINNYTLIDHLTTMIESTTSLIKVTDKSFSSAQLSEVKKLYEVLLKTSKSVLERQNLTGVSEDEKAKLSVFVSSASEIERNIDDRSKTITDLNQEEVTKTNSGAESSNPISSDAGRVGIEQGIDLGKPQAPTQQPPTTDNGNMKALLDTIILPFNTEKGKSHVARIKAINNRNPDVIRDVLKNILETPQIKQQINTATPAQLEQFANGVMRFFAEVKIDKNQPKGGTFILNKGAKESGFIQSVTDLFTSLWAAIKSQSMDPLKSWYNNKPHAIIWDIGEFKAFASQATSGTLKNIPSEQAAQVKQNFEAIFAPPSKQTQQSM